MNLSELIWTETATKGLRAHVMGVKKEARGRVDTRPLGREEELRPPSRDSPGVHRGPVHVPRVSLLHRSSQVRKRRRWSREWTRAVKPTDPTHSLLIGRGAALSSLWTYQEEDIAARHIVHSLSLSLYLSAPSSTCISLQLRRR